MNTQKLALVLNIGLLFSSSVAIAKGLNELKTDEEEDKALVEDETKEKPEVPQPPSELSKALDGRALIGLGVGLGKGYINGHSAGSLGNADLYAQYRITPPGAFSIWGTAGYVPMEFNIDVDDQSYRGIAQTYKAGGLARFAVKDGVNAYSSFELGYSVVYVHSMDNTDSEVNFATRGVTAVLAGGADFTLWPKVSIGPRLTIALGEVRTYQLAAAFDFML